MNQNEEAQTVPSKALTETVNAQHFDSVASGYDEQFGLSIDQARARVRHILKNSQRAITIGKALDLGCGTGKLTSAIVLESAANSCIGLDISPGMVSIAERMHGGITGCEFRIGSAIALPFDANSFDLCVGDAFLHHVLETDECLVEVARVLRPGGIATFNEPNAHGYAFFEFVLSSLDSSCEFRDDAIDSYLHCLRFMREHQGDRAALEAYPLPDKHVFSEEGIREAAMKAGFTGSSCVPAMDSYPTLWLDAFQYVLDAIHVSPLVREKVVEAARQLDLIMGEEARKHFCLHNQFFLYK